MIWVYRFLWVLALLCWAFWCFVWRPQGVSDFPLGNLIYYGSIGVGGLFFVGTFYGAWIKR